MATDRELRDALTLLAERAPTTCRMPGGVLPGAARPAATGPHRRPWALIGTVAALVVAVAGIVVYTVTGLSGSSDNGAPPAAAPGRLTTVTCSSSSGADVGADRRLIAQRAADLHATDVDVTTAGSTLRASMRSVKASALTDLCRAGVLDFRGVVAPPVRVTCGPRGVQPCAAGTVAKAAKDGRFTVPLADTDYAELSAAQRHRLAIALAGFDCSSATKHQAPATGYLVACTSGGTGTGTSSGPGEVAFLLGPAIVTGGQIDAAGAQSPNGQSGAVSWTVTITLDTPAGRHWAAYTTAHNSGGASTATSVERCAPTTIPCADFVGFTLDGTVISVPVTISAITGAQTQIAGSFTSVSARALAANLHSGPLPVPLTLDAVTTGR